MIDRRRLLGLGAAGTASLLFGGRAGAQMQPGAPTPGVVQATVADPAPSPDVTGRISPAARGKTLMVVNKLGLTVGFYDAATGAPAGAVLAAVAPARAARLARWPPRLCLDLRRRHLRPEPASRQPGRGDRSRATPARRVPLDRRGPRAARPRRKRPDGTIWTSCDIGAALVGFDPRSGERIATIDAGGKGGHWMVVDGRGIGPNLSNRASPGIPVIDLAARRACRTNRDAARRHRARSISRRPPAVRGRRSGSGLARDRSRDAADRVDHGRWTACRAPPPRAAIASGG